MKKILLLLFPLLLVGCTQKEEPTDCIKQYNRVYVDAVMCLHADRGCNYIGVIPGTQAKLPYLDYVHVDSLQNYRGDFVIQKGWKVCKCVPEDSHTRLRELPLRFDMNL